MTTSRLRLTVFGDLDGLGLVFTDTQQHDKGMENLGDFALLQQVMHRLGFLPAWTQQHSYGLQTNINIENIATAEGNNKT